MDVADLLSRKRVLEQAPGFDEDNSDADRHWGEVIHGYYGSKPYRDGATAVRNPS